MFRKKVYLCAGGCCPRRSLDLDKLRKYFEKNKTKVVKNPKKADYIIYLTCAFIEPFIVDATKSIKNLEKYPGELIVGGCFELIDDRFKEIFKGKSFNTLNLDKIETFFPEFKYKLSEVPDGSKFHYETPQCFSKGTLKETTHNFREDIFFNNSHIIRIADGCNANCTYCSHKKAIGKYKSKSEREILNEFVKAKPKNNIYFITAMDTGCYGMDRKTSLPKLIKKMMELKPKANFILDEVNPVYLVQHKKEILDFCKTGRIKKIQCNIQSGNKRILKLMNRYQGTGELEKIFEEIKKSKTILATQIIVGFPTENHKDLQETLDFVKDFDYVCIYPYFENKNVASNKIFPKCEDISERVLIASDYLNKKGITHTTYEP